ncbi:MAG TPA: hypothetical protein VN476_16060 [Pyrinomonadaceae bacterium]|nr:hypothetical protein [Pyrinomonadaceae bacterium]
MQSTYEARVGEQTKIQRTIVQGDAHLCTSQFGKHCKVIWPTKTAEQLALAVGCSVRAAAYELSGERPPSDKSMLVVINAIFKR